MKYIFKKNNKEIKIGDTITLSEAIETQYGKGEAVTTVTLNEENIKRMVADGIVEKVEDKKGINADEVTEKLFPLVLSMCKEYKIIPSHLLETFFITSKISIFPAFMLILKELVKTCNAGKKRKGPKWWLNPLYGFKVTPVVNEAHVYSFYREDDAREAYNTLKPFIDAAIKEQEDQECSAD